MSYTPFQSEEGGRKAIIGHTRGRFVVDRVYPLYKIWTYIKLSQGVIYDIPLDCIECLLKIKEGNYSLFVNQPCITHYIQYGSDVLSNETLF